MGVFVAKTPLAANVATATNQMGMMIALDDDRAARDESRRGSFALQFVQHLTPPLLHMQAYVCTEVWV